MHADMFVVRHARVGRAVPDRRSTCAPHVHVVNAGDGRHAHPTQGLLDMYTIRHYKKDFANLTVAIVGDVLHSRVARSRHPRADHARLCRRCAWSARKTLVPGDMAQMGVRVCHTTCDEGMRGLRRGHHAAPAERAHERRAAAVGAGVSSRATA